MPTPAALPPVANSAAAIAWLSVTFAVARMAASLAGESGVSLAIAPLTPAASTMTIAAPRLARLSLVVFASHLHSSAQATAAERRVFLRLRQPLAQIGAHYEPWQATDASAIGKLAALS